MKRIFSRLLFVAIVVNATLAFAQNEPYQITEAPKKTISIDGDISDWESIDGFEMSFAHGERSGVPNSDPLVVNIKYAWDENNLYHLVEEITDDDPTEGLNDIDWCGECADAIGGGPAPWSTDSVGFYDQGIKWPGIDDDPLATDSLEVGPYHQYWVGLAGDDMLEVDGEKQYYHIARTTNQSLNEGGTARVVGPRSEENPNSVPLVPDLEELTEPQAAHAIIDTEANGGRGRRVTEFYMKWSQIRYDTEDEREEVQERIEELLPSNEGHFLSDVKEGYEFRLEPLLVDGIEDFTFGSQTHPSGVEHPNVNHANEWEHISVVRLVGGTGDPCDFDGSGDLGIGDIDALLSEVDSGNNTASFDVNGDGSVDAADVNALVTGSDKLNTWIGDTNLDGEFNSGDLVSLFEAGQFEDALENNSTWATGDFDGDREFGTGDLVAAFQNGGFEQGAKVAAAVPEPSSLVLAMIGVLTIVRRRRV